MRKIDDRIYLGMISGAAGLVALTLVDVISSNENFTTILSNDSCRSMGIFPQRS